MVSFFVPLALAQPSSREYTVAVDWVAVSVAHAVASHPVVQSSRSRQEGANAGYEAARWQYFPAPTVSVERGSNEASSRSTTSTLRLQQTLWAGGKIDASVEVARRSADLARVGIREAKEDVAMRTLDAWQVLLSSHGRRRAAQRDYDRLRQLADMIARRVERDITANVDLVLMQSRLTQIKSDLLAFSSAQASAKQRLITWIGDSTPDSYLDDETLTMILEQPYAEFSESMLTELLGALERQPALERNALESEIARSDIAQVQGDAWPNVYLRLERQFTDVGAGSFDAATADTKLYLGMQFNPGPGLSLRSHLKAARSKVAAIELERETIRRELHDRIASDWHEYGTNSMRVGHAKSTVRAAAEVLEAYTRLFGVGRKGWLDVLNAARELGLAEQMLSDLQVRQAIGNYRLRMHQGQFDWQLGG